MPDRIRNFHMTEDTLAGVECAFSLLLAEGVDWELLDRRPDLKEACQMIKSALSDMRFEIPAETQIIPAEEEL